MAKEQEQTGGISKLKLAVGAASLFLFIVGVKRSFRTEEGREVLRGDEEWEDEIPERRTMGQRG